jgi:hypothetical protein
MNSTVGGSVDTTATPMAINTAAKNGICPRRSNSLKL